MLKLLMENIVYILVRNNIIFAIKVSLYNRMIKGYVLRLLQIFAL